MANICLLSYAVTHNAATSCRDALVAGGHTVTITDSSVANLSAHDFSQYDLIVTSRTNHADRADVAAKLNELNNAGMPLIVGTVEAGAAGSYLEMSPTVMGITGSITQHSSETGVVVVDNQHSVTLGTDLGTNTLFAVANYLGTVSEEGNHIGAALANGRSGFYAAIIAMEAGTARLNAGTPLGARIVLFPTYLISGAYTELHRTLLNQAADWALGNEVVETPVEQVEASQLVGYAVMNFPESSVGSSKLTAYAVMDLEHAQVYSSKLVSYAVMSLEVKIKVGDVLGYEGDTWENDPTGFTVQWQRDGVNIDGATGATYTLVAADVGTMIRNRLQGVNEFGTSEPVYSREVGPIEAAE